VLYSGAEGPGFKSTLSGNSLRQTVYTHRVSVHQAVRVTAGLMESNGSLLPGS